MQKNPTTTMIAKEANVSRASVYAVLNSPTNTNIGVSEHKRRHIMEAAKKLGYIRNAAASSLKTGKYKSIAVVAQSIAHAQFYRFFNTFDRLAGDNSYFAFLSSSEYSFEQERNKLNAILEHGVDALVIGLLHHEHNYETLKKYYRRGIPVVILGGARGKNRDAIVAGFDEAAGGRIIAEHLYDTGVSRIAYFKILCDQDMNGAGLEARESYLKTACLQICGKHEFESFSCGREDIDNAGEVIVQKFLDSHKDRPLPQTVVCYNDTLALECIQAFNNRGVRIPDDIAIVGYDNLNATNKSMLPLTTLDLPFERLGESCWNLLQPYLFGQIPANKPEPILLSPKLIIRESSPERLELKIHNTA